MAFQILHSTSITYNQIYNYLYMNNTLMNGIMINNVHYLLLFIVHFLHYHHTSRLDTFVYGV
jgi:hypothetical protein